MGLALRLGTRARLFRKGIAWDCFIADRGLVRCSHEPHEAQIHAFVDDMLDSRLGNCWKDIHAFSCLSNLAYQTTRKLSPESYNEMMISALYRLTHLSFDDNDNNDNQILQEAIRIGLLTFCSTIFLTRHYMEQPYEHLFGLFSSALFKLLCQSAAATTTPSISRTVQPPPPVMLWLMVLYHVVGINYRKEKEDDHNWQKVWLNNVISLNNSVDAWPQAHSILKSVMWVGFVHDAAAKKIFHTTIQQRRLGVVGTPECGGCVASPNIRSD